MKSTWALFLPLCLVVTGCNPPPKASDRYNRLEAAACDAYAELDRSRMDAVAADFPALEARARVSGADRAFDATLPDNARQVVRITEWDWGSGPAFYLVFREETGRWRLRWRRFEAQETGKDEQSGLSGAWLTREVELSPVVASRLTSLLHERCLYDEPVYLPRELSWKTGETDECMDGSQTLMEISFEGRNRSSYQVCNRGGFTREVRDVIYRVTREP